MLVILEGRRNDLEYRLSTVPSDLKLVRRRTVNLDQQPATQLFSQRVVTISRSNLRDSRQQRLHVQKHQAAHRSGRESRNLAFGDSNDSLGSIIENLTFARSSPTVAIVMTNAPFPLKSGFLTLAHAYP